MLYPNCYMEEEGRPQEQEARKAQEQKIIDSLPDDVRNNEQLMAEIDRDALQEYLRNAEKLAKLWRELDHPAHLNWFHFGGNDTYKQGQQEEEVEPQFTKLVPPYPWLNHRAHDAANLVEAARMLYTHGIGDEGPLNMIDLQMFLNSARGIYGLKVVQTDRPDDPMYRQMEIKQPSSEDEKNEHKIIEFPRIRQDEKAPEE